MLNKTDYKWIGMSSLAASLLFAGFESQAAVGDIFMVNKLYYKVLTETGSAGTVEVTKETWGYYLTGDVNIPASVKNGSITYTVTSIGENVFYNTSMTAVTIPATVTKIGDYAFYGCKSLSTVAIPNSVTSLGIGAFCACQGLTSVTLSSNLPEIGNMTFSACQKLASITIPDSVTKIGDYAFDGCTALSNVAFGKQVASIGEEAFSNCTGLTSITLPASVNYIGQYAFSDCKGLTSAAVPDTVAFIGEYAFSECDQLPSVFFSTGGKILINYSYSLTATSYTIPSTVNYIACGAFIWAEYLTNITIPDSVTKIGDYAFASCEALTSINIPASVTSIGKGPFMGCKKLSTLTVSPSNPAYTAVDNVLFNKAITTLVQYPRGKEGSSYTVPATVTVIAPDAFTECMKLDAVVLGNRVTTIGESAFWGCEFLEQINIPASVTSIGAYAFQHAGLLNVTLPEGVTEISDYAFEDCYDLRTITLGSKVTSIGEYAFSRCSSLGSFTIPASVTKIGDYAFKGCRMIESFTIPNSVTTMGSGVFSECTALSNVTFSDKLTSISSYMFKKCTHLTSINIPDNVTKIGTYAFLGCERLADVTLSRNLENIQGSVFSGCEKLTKITLPYSLKEIGYSVFNDCVKLTEVYYEGDCPAAGLSLYEGTPDSLLSYYPTGNASWIERIEGGKWRDRGVATWDPEPRPPTPTGDFTYTYENGVLTLYFTGTLCQSSDAVHWTEIPSATSPYKVAIKEKKLFFCAKAGDTPPPSKDIIIPLADGVDLEMLWVEPGTFMMGSPENEFGRFIDEVQHQVTLTKGYWLGKYEVTQAQYVALMGSNYSQFKDPARPVECVFWSEATNFCAKLTEIERAAGRLPEGYEYTLPTEAQWEYACRAGTSTGLYSGKENTSTRGVCPNVDEIAWYDQNSGSTTHLPGQKQPNAWGFYDMAGNVAEWCQDWMGAYSTQAQVDPTGPETGKGRVLRGGDWNNYAQFCRSAARHSNPPDSWITSSIGFRVALTATGSSETCGLPVPGLNAKISLPNNVDLKMIWIEPGTFIMGSPEDELGRFDDETQHQVTLTQGYWLGTYEVTQAQYQALMNENPSEFKGADLPVQLVTWYNAKDFCAKLNEIEKAAGRLPEGYEYTLPTEAQWEYACRAGTTTALNSGKNLSDEDECPEIAEVGWYKYDSDGTPHPVGQKLPNAWGLYDMHGNVYEWCSDVYDDYPPVSEVTDPVGPESGVFGPYRVLRGGSWNSVAYLGRSAYRNGNSPEKTVNIYGFRLALVAATSSETSGLPVPGSNASIILPNDKDLDMIWVEPGTFMMGSPQDELGKQGNETYQQVTITQGYWMGKYEVTQAQYEAVMGTNPAGFRGDNNPVEFVSWDDAMEFCAKLTEIEKAAGRLPEGYEYSLPTEAQWEYACRAGTTTALNSGKNLSGYNECPEVDEVAWYTYNSNSTTHPVGQKQANAWGLYDMHGNVLEWCLDWYPGYENSMRVLRGGSYSSLAFMCRSAYQGGSYPGSRWNYIGFRLALIPAQ